MDQNWTVTHGVPRIYFGEMLLSCTGIKRSPFPLLYTLLSWPPFRYLYIVGGGSQSNPTVSLASLSFMEYDVGDGGPVSQNICPVIDFASFC